MYIAICKIDEWCKFGARSRALKSQCSGTTQRDGVVGGGGKVVQDGGTHVSPWLIYVGVWQKPLQYCKVLIFQ